MSLFKKKKAAPVEIKTIDMSIKLQPVHWWVENVNRFDQPNRHCRAMVRFKSVDKVGGEDIEIKKEELFETIGEASTWLQEQLGTTGSVVTSR